MPQSKPTRSPSETNRTCGAFEPARTQLSRLSRLDLERLVRQWLTALGMKSVIAWPGPRSPLTVSTVLGVTGLSVLTQVRVFQRTRRLQAHHVEAFLGHLVRTGSGAGILVTTGEYTPAAAEAARSTTTPHIRILSGSDWVAELAHTGTGVRRIQLTRWALSLAPPPVDPASPPPARRLW